jgi:hypothetical protein
MGGENQRGSLNRITGYSEKAQCTGNPAYLEPNSQSMQKPIGGRSLLAFSAFKSMLKNQDKHIWSLIAVHCRKDRGERVTVRARLFQNYVFYKGAIENFHVKNLLKSRNQHASAVKWQNILIIDLVRLAEENIIAESFCADKRGVRFRRRSSERVKIDRRRGGIVLFVRSVRHNHQNQSGHHGETEGHGNPTNPSAYQSPFNAYSDNDGRIAV